MNGQKHGLDTLYRQRLPDNFPRREVHMLQPSIPRHLEVILARMIVLKRMNVSRQGLELALCRS